MTTIFAGPTVFTPELDPGRRRKKSLAERDTGASDGPQTPSAAQYPAFAARDALATRREPASDRATWRETRPDPDSPSPVSRATDRDAARRQALPSVTGGFTRARPTAPSDARPAMRGSTRTRKRSHLLALSGASDALPGEQPHMRTITVYLNSHFLNQAVSVLTQAGRVYGTLTDVAHDEITLIDAEQHMRRLPLSSILSIGPKT